MLIAIKAILITAAARVFGWSTPGAVQISFLLAQGSEFVFVIIAMPVVCNALGEDAVGVVVTGIAASLALTPSLAALGHRIARMLKQMFTASAPTAESRPSSATAPVVIFGMDDVGRSVADALEANGLPYDAIEMDYDRFLAASADGYPAAFGDLGDVRLMETLGIAERSAIVVTVVRYELSNALTPIMRDRYPTLTRFILVDTD